MFHISDTHIPTCATYDAAVRIHTSRRPWRGSDDTSRPLGSRRQRWLTIRRDVNDDLVARMYQTDIIRWRPDGAIALVPYRSAGTNRVVAALLRGTGIYPLYTGPLGPCLWLGVAHDVANVIRMTPEAAFETVVQHDPQTGRYIRHPDQPVVPFTQYTLNRAATRALYAEYNLTGFQTWLAAWDALTPEPSVTERGTMRSVYDWPDLLADPAQWPVLGAACRAATRSQWRRTSVQQAMPTLRKSLWRQHPEVIQTTRHDDLTLTAFRNVERQYRQYQIYAPYHR